MPSLQSSFQNWTKQALPTQPVNGTSLEFDGDLTRLMSTPVSVEEVLCRFVLSSFSQSWLSIYISGVHVLLDCTINFPHHLLGTCWELFIEECFKSTSLTNETRDAVANEYCLSFIVNLLFNLRWVVTGRWPGHHSTGFVLPDTSPPREPGLSLCFLTLLRPDVHFILGKLAIPYLRFTIRFRVEASLTEYV